MLLNLSQPEFIKLNIVQQNTQKLAFRYFLNDENMDDFTGIARDDIGSYTNIKECKLIQKENEGM